MHRRSTHHIAAILVVLVSGTFSVVWGQANRIIYQSPLPDAKYISQEKSIIIRTPSLIDHQSVNVAVSINGLGLRELSISYIFPELGVISVQAALSLAILLRGLDLMISLPGSFFLPGVLSEARKNGEESSPVVG